jgi:hypothetical protein
VGGRWGKDVAARSSGSRFPGGAALLGREAGEAWVLIDDGEVARLGPAVALCVQAGVPSRIQVLVDESVPGAAGVIARRASAFGGIVDVWRVEGRSLVPAEPDPATSVPEAPPDPSLVDLLVAHGVEPVLEHGVLRGEVLGLEVARVIDGRLVVGVGRHDRNARAEMRPGEDAGAALDSAVGAVMRWRRPGVARHAANTLARGRWLRSLLVARPSLVGLASVRPVAPPLPWFDLPEAGTAPATAVDPRGGEVVVACSVGVDLDLVPTAADCRLLYGSHPEVPLWLVVPAGDDVPATRRLAGMLTAPASVVTVPRDWERLGAGP